MSADEMSEIQKYLTKRLSCMEYEYPNCVGEYVTPLEVCLYADHQRRVSELEGLLREWATRETTGAQIDLVDLCVRTSKALEGKR
jgi:hypothetical protein